MSTGEREYVLGTSDAEIDRLGLQHRLWGETARAIWRRAGFCPGQTLLDVGCGPGFGALELAEIVGSTGRIIGIDESARFLAYLRGECARRNVANIDARHGDVQQLDLPSAGIDGAYARWVLCFVREPERVVRAVARALRPGGVFAVQDYFNYTALALAPRSAIFGRVVQAIEARWRAHGGDPDLVARLPRMLREAGLTLREIAPITRALRPSDDFWQWPTTFFRNFVPTLVPEGFLKQSEADELAREWQSRSADPDTFFFTPPVFDVIATKP